MSSVSSKNDLLIEWKRPKDLCKRPYFVEDEKNICHDIQQGKLGNCWMVAAMSCLAVNPTLWNLAVPNCREQEWKGTEDFTGYAGIFRFCFWKYGTFMEVVVDDLLPCKDGKPLFIHNKSTDEYWCALMEKAYAKLHGSYEMLEGGELGEALEDFTGGISETSNLPDLGLKGNLILMESFFTTLQTDFHEQALMAAAIPAQSTKEQEQVTTSGLIIGHAYSITAIRKISTSNQGKLRAMVGGEKLSMVRLRNPWGDAGWKGAFGPNSEEWLQLGEKDRIAVGLVCEKHGEFWMKYSDFLESFVHLSVCRIINNIFSYSKHWFPYFFYNSWRLPDLAGGSVNNPDTFLLNPQYLININEGDSFMIALTQMIKRRAVHNVIGFTIMKVEENRLYRVQKTQNIFVSSPFKDSRTVFLKQKKIAKGRYVLVATTFEPEIESKFLLRIFLSAKNPPQYLVAEMPSAKSLACLPGRGLPQLATRITVFKAIGINRSNDNPVVNAYIAIKCEGEKVVSKFFKNSPLVDLDFSALFYRRQPQKPIIIEVLHSGMVVDELIGRVTIAAEEAKGDQEGELMLESKNAETVTPGSLGVRFTTSFNLKEF